MLPTKRLILALRETAQELREHPEKYDWNFTDTCNCGRLAANLGFTGRTRFSSTWTQAKIRRRDFCPYSGTDLKTLFAFLTSCGIEDRDFQSIETLDGQRGYNDSFHVAQWMDQKADELERRRVNEKEAK